MNLTDDMFRLFAKQAYFGNENYVLDTLEFLQTARTTGQTPGVHAWIADLLAAPAVIQSVQPITCD